MKIDDLYPSRWLKASDLHGKPALHIIDGLTVEEFDDGESKPVLLLHNSKGMVLNRTNAGLIASFLGDNTDSWKGQRIVLYPAKVDFRGRIVEAIRVREPRLPHAASAATSTPAILAGTNPNPKPGPIGAEDDVAF